MRSAAVHRDKPPRMRRHLAGPGNPSGIAPSNSSAAGTPERTLALSRSMNAKYGAPAIPRREASSKLFSEMGTAAVCGLRQDWRRN